MAKISCENYIIFTMLWKFNGELEEKIREIEKLSMDLDEIYKLIMPKNEIISDKIMEEYNDELSIEDNIKHLAEINIEVE
jgi:hypothetical protein